MSSTCFFVLRKRMFVVLIHKPPTVPFLTCKTAKAEVGARALPSGPTGHVYLSHICRVPCNLRVMFLTYSTPDTPASWNPGLWYSIHIILLILSLPFSH